MNFEKISLPRYNVPHNQLITGSDVLNEFKKNLADSVVTIVSEKISLAYKNYKLIIDDTVDFNVLNNPKTALETVLMLIKTVLMYSIYGIGCRILLLLTTKL
jgi:hypothetical protein